MTDDQTDAKKRRFKVDWKLAGPVLAVLAASGITATVSLVTTSINLRASTRNVYTQALLTQEIDVYSQALDDLQKLYTYFAQSVNPADVTSRQVTDVENLSMPLVQDSNKVSLVGSRAAETDLNSALDAAGSFESDAQQGRRAALDIREFDQSTNSFDSQVRRDLQGKN